MPENKIYGTIITAAGAALIADCILQGTKLPITQAAAGDGNGAYYQPTVDQVALKHEVWRGPITRVEQSALSPQMLDVKIVMGDDVGGFTVREMALFDDQGTMIAICNTPDTEKVIISGGVSGKLTMLMHIVVADTSVLTFSITPALDMLSMEDMQAHNTDPEAHRNLFAITRPQLLVTAESGAEVTVTDGTTTLTAASTGAVLSFDLPNFGTWTATAQKGGEMSNPVDVVIDTVKIYSVTLGLYKIYGAEWDGTSTTAWSRTDDAADFTDPVPYVSGASNYGSPFDNIAPWSGMVKSERAGGTMVAIPKFWYKLTKSGSHIKVQIANKEPVNEEGFVVSPAHMDRGDGSGERDVVYIGRYHCGATAYKSVSGQLPKVSVTRSAARAAIHALGDNLWQMDFATRFTIWLLYIVEFANWNSQSKIGYGCGNNSGVQNVGASDAMPYHTGTMQASRTAYGVGVQYRNIEGLWDNCLDWMDGCYYNTNGMNIILKPSAFADNTGGVLIGKPKSGYPSALGVSEAAGFPMLYPTTANGSENTYSCDYWDYSTSYPCLYAGGDYYQYLDYGLFCISCNGVTDAYGYIGCRLLELP